MPACPGCGLDLGAEDCHSLFEELNALVWTDVRYAKQHRKAVDAYALQHDPYIESPKSLMAHLGGLCCALERGSDPAVHQALLQSLNGKSVLSKPKLPEFRGALTIASIMRPAAPATHQDAVDRWARSVWEAYGSLHGFARQWIDKALQSHR
jgi:hypothetical protein